MNIIERYYDPLDPGAKDAMRVLIEEYRQMVATEMKLKQRVRQDEAEALHYLPYTRRQLIRLDEDMSWLCRRIPDSIDYDCAKSVVMEFL